MRDSALPCSALLELELSDSVGCDRPPVCPPACVTFNYACHVHAFMTLADRRVGGNLSMPRTGTLRIVKMRPSPFVTATTAAAAAVNIDAVIAVIDALNFSI